MKLTSNDLHTSTAWSLFLILATMLVPKSPDESVVIILLVTYMLTVLTRQLNLTSRLILWLVLATVYVTCFYESPTTFIIGSLLGAVLGSQLLRLSHHTKWLLILPIIGAMTLLSFNRSTDIRQYLRQDPVATGYGTDGQMFISAYYRLVKSGNYYPSFRDAHVENLYFYNYVPQTVWAWRPATIFYIWKWITFGQGELIWWWSLVMAIGMSISGVVLAEHFLPQKFSHLALLTSYLLLPMVVDIHSNEIVTMMEWWAVALFTIGITCYISGKKRLALPFLIISCLTRELMIFTFGFLFVAAWLVKRVEFKRFAAVMVAFATFAVFHISQALQAMGQPFALSRVRGKWHPFGLDLPLITTSYGSRLYFGSRIHLFWLFWLLILLFVLVKPSWNKLVVGSLVLISPLAFLVVGIPPSFHFGLLYTPLMVLLVPATYSVFVHLGTWSTRVKKTFQP